jgi:hypothetical protein
MIPHFRKSVAVWTVPKVRRFCLKSNMFINVNVEHWWNNSHWEEGAGPEYSKKTLFQCHFFHHKPHMGFNLDRIYSSYRTVNALRIGYKTNQLMTYKETIVVCSENRTKHTIALIVLNV